MGYATIFIPEWRDVQSITVPLFLCAAAAILIGLALARRSRPQPLPVSHNLEGRLRDQLAIATMRLGVLERDLRDATKIGDRVAAEIIMNDVIYWLEWHDMLRDGMKQA